MQGVGIELILGQIAGAIALAFLISTYFKKDKISIAKTMLISNIFYILHYFLIGALSGCYALVVALLRDYYILLREKHHKKYRHRALYNNSLVFIGIFAIYFCLIIINFNEPLNILPPFAGLLYFTFEWFGNRFLVKLSSGTASSMWLAYDITNFSVPGIITDVLSIVACIIGLLKYRRRGRRKPHKRHKK